MFGRSAAHQVLHTVAVAAGRQNGFAELPVPLRAGEHYTTTMPLDHLIQDRSITIGQPVAFGFAGRGIDRQPGAFGSSELFIGPGIVFRAQRQTPFNRRPGQPYGFSKTQKTVQQMFPPEGNALVDKPSVQI